MIKALYLDDLSIWRDYDSSSLLQFMLNMGANKFRPVFYFLLYGIFSFAGENIEFIGIINLIFANIISILFFLICKKVCKNELVSFFSSFFWLISRFSYYNINQVFGLMEALALIMALLILFFLYEYINENKENSYYFACLFYFLISYVHERYIILFPLFLYAIIIKKINYKTTFRYCDIIKKIIIPCLCFILFFVVRFMLFKDRMLDGTGGTDATQTFDLIKVIRYFFSQIVYIMGINNGELYLNGINWGSMLNVYKGFSLMVFGLILLLIIVSCYVLLKGAKKRQKEYITNIILILMFISLCILSSSITIRVEMRWIYVSYAASLILFAYLIKILIEMIEDKTKNKIYLWGGIAVFCICIIPLEHYYRSNYHRLYYWPVMVAAESLYERTYYKYGEALWDKTLIVYCKEEFMTSENIKDILLPLNKKRYLDNFEVHVVNNLEEVDIKYSNRDIVVLNFDNTVWKYTDVTDIVNEYQIIQNEK